MKKRTALIALFSPAMTAAVLITSGCKVGHVFHGPGYDPSLGVTHSKAGQEVLVAVTTGRVEDKSGFTEQLRSVLQSMPAEQGLIGYSVQKELIGRQVWTLSAWTDEQALTNFLRGQAHRHAVRDGGIPRDTVRSATYWLPTNEVPPNWDDAVKALDP